MGDLDGTQGPVVRKEGAQNANVAAIAQERR